MNESGGIKVGMNEGWLASVILFGMSHLQYPFSILWDNMRGIFY
jgi:hypothetical protein